MKVLGSKAVAEMVALSGSRVVGRTKLQKCICALELAGVGYGFPFTYRHFGPYSEELKIASNDAAALGYISEETETASWGGWYSVFQTKLIVDKLDNIQKVRRDLLAVANNSDSVELELAVTAAFLAKNGVLDAWNEVAKRKPTKASNDRIAAAKKLYEKLRAVDVPEMLPNLS